ncbi:MULTISPECIES: hypothetical protein [Aequorivita]|uniref:Uncharacterized protein n=2 Tax=Aequorivita TaxID=153265 RepID=A0AB35YTN3_9FLAO|nr:hypothetical protein [Aequorivita sp. Ant34-E75]WGF92346.1 hypothetical protein QCQ61_14195 [Aequorivita sp. Ant34-E75]
MKNKITLIIFLISIGISFGQNEKPNREPFVLKLAVDSVNYYQQEIQKSPYFVKDNILQIFPSEKINIEVEIENDSIISMKTVEKVEFPEKTITIDFKQEVKDRKSEMMMLTVKNPFDKTMTYDARMFIVGREELLKTSIIPIRPKLTNFEMWNDVIITLILDNWEWTAK